MGGFVRLRFKWGELPSSPGVIDAQNLLASAANRRASLEAHSTYAGTSTHNSHCTTNTWLQPSRSLVKTTRRPSGENAGCGWLHCGP